MIPVRASLGRGLALPTGHGTPSRERTAAKILLGKVRFWHPRLVIMAFGRTPGA